MKKAKKNSIILAFVLILAGVLVSAAAYAAIDGDFTRLSTAVTEESTYSVASFDSIFINTQLTDVEIAASEDGTCRVVLSEYKNMNTTVEIQNNTLCIRQTDNRKWHEKVGILIFEPKITVYLPEGDYQNLSIGMANGDVKVSDHFSFTDAMINTIRGDIYFGAAVKNRFSSETVFGELTLVGVNAEEIICETEQYDIYLRDCDANVLKLTTVNGNVEGALLSEKTFTAHSQNGEVDVPDSTGGGTCEISTVNGDVKITIK